MRKVLLGLAVVLSLVVLVSSVSATVPPPIPVYVDIKPESWPNPLQLRSRGVLPVAILGTEEFDVTYIDPATIELTRETLGDIGVSPLRWSWEDVATPYTADMGGGHEDGPDGYLDLSLKFKAQEVIETLRLVPNGIILIISGNLKVEFDGAPIQGQDYIVVLG